MRIVVAIWRLARTIVHVLHGMAIMAIRFPSLDARGRQERVRWWSRKLIRLLGIELETRGLQPSPGATLIVANHISWLDVAAIHAVAPHARFVSKSDVRHWPLVGLMVAGAGTLFIERERKRDAMRVVHQMAQALEAGDTVAVFPEGTTGDGAKLLPFHANLLQAAIGTSTPIQPIALRYSEPGHEVSPSVDFVGEMTLAENLWNLARAKGVRVSVEVLAPQASAHADRRRLAAHVREVIGQALGEGAVGEPSPSSSDDGPAAVQPQPRP